MQLTAKRYPTIIAVFAVIFLLTTSKTVAQPGFLDPTFNIQDSVVAKGFDNLVRCCVKQPDGKLLVGGYFTNVHGVKRTCIARLNADGSLDHSFKDVEFKNPGYNYGASGQIYCIAIQADGKIVIGGAFDYVAGMFRKNIARLLPNGDIDSFFNSGTGFNKTVLTLACQADGKIIAGGSFTSFNSFPVGRIARLNTDGSLEIPFNTGVGANNNVQSILIDSIGRIYVTGSFSNFNSISTGVVRLLSNGVIDGSYNVSVSGPIAFSVLKPTGKLILAGSGVQSGTKKYIIQLDTTGAVDASFTSPVNVWSNIWNLLALNGNKSAVLGSFPKNIIVFNDNGTIDSAFNVLESFDFYDIKRLHTSCDLGGGKLFVAGDFSSYGNRNAQQFAVFNNDGSIDQDFISPAFGLNESSDQVTISLGQQILVSGEFNFYNQSKRKFFARLQQNGDVDTLFNSSTGPNAKVSSLAVQPDGKVIIGGNFSQIDGKAAKNIARFYSDGSLDSTFNPTNNISTSVFRMALQQDGKIIIGNNLNGFMRLLPNGSVDASFNYTVSAGSSLYTQIGMHQNGKIIVAGYFSSLGGSTRPGIGRLNVDGSLDNTFNPVINGNAVRCFAVQPNNKIIIGGEFTSVGGFQRNSVARLNWDGSNDSTFNSVFAYGTTINSILVQPTGHIIVAYGKVEGDNFFQIVRLDSSGNYDYSFNPVKCNGTIMQMALDSHSIIAVGRFSSINNTVRNNIAKIQAQVYTPNYTFNGNGSWNDPANWLGGQIPTNPIPVGTVVLVNPSTGGSCTFNGSLTISSGATLLIPPNVNFTVNGNIIYL